MAIQPTAAAAVTIQAQYLKAVVETRRRRDTMPAASGGPGTGPNVNIEVS
jgi:hypothetical protein